MAHRFARSNCALELLDQLDLRLAQHDVVRELEEEQARVERHRVPRGADVLGCRKVARRPEDVRQLHRLDVKLLDEDVRVDAAGVGAAAKARREVIAQIFAAQQLRDARGTKRDTGGDVRHHSHVVVGEEGVQTLERLVASSC